MSKFKAGLGGNAGVIGSVAVVLVVLALGVWIGNKRDVADAPAPAALMQPQSDGTNPEETENAPAQAEPKIQAETKPEQAENTNAASKGATATVDVAAPPAFDEVRREPDGMTVVAGRAAPGASVQLLRDGAVIATATADRSGKFATLAMIAPDGEGHILSLSQQVDGTDIPSEDEIILAPTKAPQVVADAQPEKPIDTAQTPEPKNSEPVASLEPADPAVPQSTVTGPDAKAEEPANTQASEADTAAAEAASLPAPAETAATAPDVAVLKSTSEGVELLTSQAPEVMDAVALDTISYSEQGGVQLAGRAQPDTRTVRIYLDNDAVINLPVDDKGRWRGDVPDVDEGIYTLRVDEVGDDGTVTSRVETPFKRESATVLSQAAAEQQGPIKAITVQTGATLWAIARDRYGDGKLYVRVFEANADDIRDPDLIYPGQVFDLPD